MSKFFERTARALSACHAQRRFVVAVAIVSLLAVSPSMAQPGDNVVRLVVPYPPGGGTDLIARSLAQALSVKWKRGVIVDNRAGAAGMVGAEAVARSPGDGLTLLVTDASPVVIAPNLPSSSYRFNPLVDLVPVALLARQTPVLAVNKDVPVSSVREFISYANRNPGLPYASIGAGSSFHIAMEQFQKEAGVSMLHVPYKGTGPLMADLLGGEVKAAMLTLPSVNGLDRDKKLKILGVIGPTPAAGRADLPVVGQSDLPGYKVNLWFGLFAPAKTSQALLRSLHADVATVLAEPDFVKASLGPQFLTAGRESREQFGQIVESDNTHWARLIKMSNVKE